MSSLSPEKKARLNALLERYRPVLRIIALKLLRDPRLKRRFDPSDVVNEAMLRAVRGIDHCRAEDDVTFLKWLKVILENTFRDMIRQHAAALQTPDVEVAIHDSTAMLDNFMVAPGPSPSEVAQGREVAIRFAEQVEKLPSEQREVVLLRDVHGLPIKDIAEMTGRTEKAVAGLLARGRRALRTSFPDHEEGGGGG